MKPTLKTYLKTCFILLFVSITLVNCEKDEQNLEINNTSNVVDKVSETSNLGINIQRVSLEQLEQKENLRVSLEKISSKLDKNKTEGRNTSQSRVDANDGSFVILTEEILQVQTDSTVTYTFLIQTPTDETSSFENFVLIKNNDDSYAYFIYKYSKINSEEEFNYTISTQEVSEDQINLEDFENYIANRVTMDLVGSDGCTYTLEYLPDESPHPLMPEGTSSWVIIDGPNCPESGGGGTDEDEDPNPDYNTPGETDEDTTGNGGTGSGSNNGGGTGNTTENGSNPPTGILLNEGAIYLPLLLDLTSEEIRWLENHTTQSNQLYNYVIAGGNPPSSETLEFGELALEAYMNDDVVYYNLEIIIKKKLNDDYPCHANVIFEAYSVCSPLTQIVLDIFEANDGTNLTFDYSNTISSNANTFPVAIYNPVTHTCDIKIRFRESFLNTATDLSIARTTIHETVHAILVFMWEEGYFYLPNGTVDPDFSQLFNAYTLAMSTQNMNGLNWPQHQYMTNLINDIATALQAYGVVNGYDLPFNFYQKLSWGGGVIEFYEPKYLPNGNPTPEYITLVNTIVAEQNNTNIYYDGKGNQIFPQGQAPNATIPCN